MVKETTASESEAIRVMKEKLCKLETTEGRRRGMEVRPELDGVLICTAPKCGTTWVQHIVHGIRSRGNLDFDEISCVIPCLEMAWDSGIDPQAPQEYSPAAYKTHFYYPFCPSGCKKIFVTRDPLDAAPSFYHFFNGWFFDKDSVSMDQFLQEFFMRRGKPENWEQNASHWHHLTAWYPLRHNPDVLWLHFEDLKEDLRACVALIAEFIGCDAKDEELLDLVTKQSSLEFMLSHSEKFDEHHLKLARNTICGLPERAGLDGTSAAKIREGRSGTGKDQLGAELVQSFHRKWQEVVKPATNFDSYAEMRASIIADLGRPWASH